MHGHAPFAFDGGQQCLLVCLHTPPGAGRCVCKEQLQLLMSFCMTQSSTHSRGRHLSSIPAVEDAGKHLEAQKENKRTEQKMGWDKSCGWTKRQQSTLLHSAQEEMHEKHLILRGDITKDEVCSFWSKRGPLSWGWGDTSFYRLMHVD